ncbi:MAG: VWA domain-containing protein [Acidobacteria bacterium]|nr:VWA domain-containing protein [Acidobacteriota bacterium]
MNLRKSASFFLFFSVICFCSGLAAQDGKRKKPPLFKVGVETVFVKVAVSDSSNRFVTGLDKEHFKIFEDKVEQEIVHFEQQSAPISVGIIFDISHSMKANANIKKAKNAIARFLESGNPRDEYLLITFNQDTELVRDFGQRVSTLQNDIVFQKPGGDTALYDAVYMGLSYVLEGTNDKKALILITDGEDNKSRYSPSEIREFAKETDVQIYGIGERGEYDYGFPVIEKIVSLTGGRAFFPNNFNELDYYIDLIHAELRHQYVLGYRPTNQVHDGKWRRIKVELDAPRGLPKLKVHAREGYYAPKD